MQIMKTETIVKTTPGCIFRLKDCKPNEIIPTLRRFQDMGLTETDNRENKIPKLHGFPTVLKNKNSISIIDRGDGYHANNITVITDKL